MELFSVSVCVIDFIIFLSVIVFLRGTTHFDQIVGYVIYNCSYFI